MKPSYSILWIFFNLTLGAIAGAALGWGPLAAPLPLIPGLALAGAAVGVAIGVWSRPRPRRRYVGWGHGGILLFVALATLIPLYRIGAIAPPGETRAANFARLQRALDYAYPYFELKGVDRAALYARYAPQTAAAASDDDYWRIVAYMLAELNDGHSGLLSPSVRSGRHYFATCRALGDTVAVDAVGQTARESGLVRGDVVLAVDGRPVADALEALPAILRAGSTPQQRRAKAAFSLLSTTAETLSVTVAGPAGERTLTLVWPAPASPAQATSPGAGEQPLITGERLPSGWGLIRIPSFAGDSGHDLVAEFDAALAAVMDAPGIILDLRGNGGGSTAIADPIAGRFLDRPFTYGHDRFRARLPQRGWRTSFDYRVTPRRPTYTGPLTLLIDEFNFSTAENFIVALVDSGRATTVGRPTAGGSGNPVTFRLSGGGLARFSTGDFRRNDGRPIEGLGIAPDVYVAWTAADLRLGRDLDLEAAIALRKRLVK
ncbi:MAG TPA: S41 family peptidase [Anaerolineae bacterium]|nr:S41 family peptidase [Anaerolineae bacterium]